jgi:DNA repair protein RadC
MDKTKPLLSTEDILPCLKFIRNKKQEYILCLSLDSGNRLIARRVVTIGTLTSSLIHPREVFAGPLKDRAASVIIAHNHPSGDPEPSRADISSTQQLVAAGILLGISLRDHIIVSGTSHYSFKQNYLIEDDRLLGNLGQNRLK